MAKTAATDEARTLEAILGQVRELNRLVGDIAARLASQAQGDMDPGRAIDPGDAVPEGVAPTSPAPLTAEDEKAREALERLPRRRTTKRKSG